MLKSIDILLGLSVVMLMVSLVVTVFTQALTNLMQTRGKHLLDGVAGLLRQIHKEVPAEVSRKIADAILTHPLIKAAGTKYGTVIHREELTALILELASGDAPHAIDDCVREGLGGLLKANGVDDPAKTMDNVRLLTLQLEQAHPELSNNERYAMAFLQEAPGRFLAKMNGWFDPMIDRVADRFTNETRKITFVGSLIVALVLQLDTVALVNRLAADPALRQALVTEAIAAEKRDAPQAAPAAPDKGEPAPQTLAAPAGTKPAANAGQAPAANAGQAKSGDSKGTDGPVLIPVLSAQDQNNLKVLSQFDVIDIPTGVGDYFVRLLGTDKKGKPAEGLEAAGNVLYKLVGMLLTAMLLSLGAPFWYNALKNLIRLRSLVAQKDDDQRAARQTNTGTGDNTVTASVTTTSVTATPALLAGERGDLSRVG